MKIAKKNIIYASIDLFAEHGVQNVPIELIAERADCSRGNIYYHFKKYKDVKDEIIDHILKIFDELLKMNTPSKHECLDVNADARSILSKLFFTFREADSNICRKINRIIFCDHIYVEKINKYLFEEIHQKREERLIQCFDTLIRQKKVDSFDTATAARILNSIFIVHAMEDSNNYPFKDNELPPHLEKLQNDCMFVVRQILNGHFRT